MSVLTALARAQAVAAGRAQPLTTVRHTHLGARPLVLVPLHLAGETAAPLAAFVGEHPDQPRLLMVGNPRDRSERFAFTAELAEVVLSYVDSFSRAVEDAGGGRMRYSDAPQIIVPNGGGVDFLRLLGRSTRFRRSYGPYAVPVKVPMLGRWLTFFHDRHEHPGSALLLAMTQVLGAHYATGQSGQEDLNLAAQLAWIDPPDGMTGVEAAALAEDPLLYPPAGPSTDPTFDNEILAPLIGTTTSQPVLAGALRGQLAPTWRLLWQALGLLRGLPEGASVEARWTVDKDAFSSYHISTMDGSALPQPRLDSAVAAAGRLDRLEREQARYDAQRALDDPLVMAEFRLAGEAFAGTVVGAHATRVELSAKNKKVLRPEITVHTDDPVRMEIGAALTSPTRPAQKAVVVDVSPPLVVLHLSGGTGRSLTPPPGSVPELGESVTYTATADSFQPPGKFPSRDETPWTHGGPPPVFIPTETDAVEDWE